MLEILQSWWELGNHLIAQALFLRLMGLIYLFAFLSILIQVKGLFGKKGILPADVFLGYAKSHLGAERYYILPTLFWINCSDGALVALCALGALVGASLAIGMFSGIIMVLALALLWLLYLSYKAIGQDFLAYQWDSLLLEVGFASIIFAASGPSAFGILLMWFIAWKFMVMAGLVKLLSGDPTWRDLSAMTYHYETQPLPNPLSWYAQKLPLSAHKATALMTFFIEIATPFLFFGPPELRLAAFAVQVLLQLAILATGNYGPFNLLTIVLMVPLLSDNQLNAFQSVLHPSPPIIPSLLLIPLVLALIALNLILVFRLFLFNMPGESILSRLAPLSIVNPYGLFAVMTTRRDEVILEWSEDGERWTEYEFKWKPGDLRVAPKWNMPHQPRLDWQMWFAALGRYEDNPWFVNLLVRLMDNSPDVTALMAKVPQNPPRFIRASLYRYHFTDWKTKKKSGTWWSREYICPYCPIISMRDI